MPGDLWRRCAGADHLRRLGGKAWRVVEGQHVISTRKLVDSAEEQELLERLLDDRKPRYPTEDGFENLHYLLATPFRYPPLAHGSRFGTRAEPSLWYGARTLHTALGETAYYRLLFLAGTEAELAPVVVEMSAFRATLRTTRGIDLCRTPFDAHRAQIASPTRYDRTQQLGAAMRSAGVEAFRYPSARDPVRGVNVALFTPRAFASKLPDPPEIWSAVAADDAVEFSKRDVYRRRWIRFPRERFEVEGRLPSPAV